MFRILIGRREVPKGNFIPKFGEPFEGGYL